MVPCKNPRKVSNVIICVQLENGNRLSGEFPSTVNVQFVLDDLKIDFNKETALINYIQREVSFIIRKKKE